MITSQSESRLVISSHSKLNIDQLIIGKMLSASKTLRFWHVSLLAKWLPHNTSVVQCAYLTILCTVSFTDYVNYSVLYQIYNTTASAIL